MGLDAINKTSLNFFTPDPKVETRGLSPFVQKMVQISEGYFESFSNKTFEAIQVDATKLQVLRDKTDRETQGWVSTALKVLSFALIYPFVLLGIKFFYRHHYPVDVITKENYLSSLIANGNPPLEEPRSTIQLEECRTTIQRQAERIRSLQEEHSILISKNRQQGELLSQHESQLSALQTSLTNEIYTLKINHQREIIDLNQGHDMMMSAMIADNAYSRQQQDAKQQAAFRELKNKITILEKQLSSSTTSSPSSSNDNPVSAPTPQPNPTETTPSLQSITSSSSTSPNTSFVDYSSGMTVSQEERIFQSYSNGIRRLTITKNESVESQYGLTIAYCGVNSKFKDIWQVKLTSFMDANPREIVWRFWNSQTFEFTPTEGNTVTITEVDRIEESKHVVNMSLSPNMASLIDQALVFKPGNESEVKKIFLREDIGAILYATKIIDGKLEEFIYLAKNDETTFSKCSAKLKLQSRSLNEKKFDVQIPDDPNTYELNIQTSDKSVNLENDHPIWNSWNGDCLEEIILPS